MSEKKHTPTYSAEFREHGVRMYRSQHSGYANENAARRSPAP